MSVLGRFLLKHLALHLGCVWMVLTLSVFVLGVVELSMNRLSDAVGQGSGSVFAEIMQNRIEHLPEYASETMAYAGMAGFLLGFWSLWRHRELLQYQLLGARAILWRYTILTGLLFGTLHMTVVETWKHRQDKSLNKVVHNNLRIVRNAEQGGRIMLFADRYRPHNGTFQDARVLKVDEAFRVQSVFYARSGRIEPTAWVIRNGTRLNINLDAKLDAELDAKLNASSERTFFRKERFAIETDLVALAHALQPNPQALSLLQLPQAIRAARANLRNSKPFFDRALFLLSLPLFYASFGMLAYALCLTLPHRTTGRRMALFVVLLPCSIEFLRHIAWSRVFAESLHPSLPAIGIPIACACITGFLVRNERLFS